jgi:hypothetical protein
MERTSIPGYTFGTPAAARSPLTMHDLELLQKTLLFGEEDVKYLRLSREVLASEVEAILDVWYGFVASNPHLVQFFAGADGRPDGAYLAAVRKRFGQWILDTAAADYGERWLDYQHEIGLRHHRAKKNLTDAVTGGSPIVAFRYLVPLAYPITATLRPFLAKRGHGAEDVEKMHAAWVKAVLLQVTLWSYPYVKDGDF